MASSSVKRALTLLRVSKVSATHRLAFVRCMGGHAEELPIKLDIGKREVVGFGMNGEEAYHDDVRFPYPAIRFREDNAQIAMLREKAKGDWKKLTVEEKKTLYRADFCQTFSEMKAPDGRWSKAFGVALLGISAALAYFCLMSMFALQPLPNTITDPELLKDNMNRMVKLRLHSVRGLATEFDYENGGWKKDKK